MLFTDELLNVLPRESRQKVLALDAAREGAHAAVTSAETRWHEAHSAYIRAKADAEQRVRDYDAKSLGSAEQKVIFAAATQEKLQPLKSALDAAADARTKAEAAFAGWNFLSAAVRHLDCSGAFTRFHATGAVLKHAKAAVPAGTTNLAKAIADARAKLEALDSEWREVEHAPAKVEDLKRGLVEEVDRIAAEGAPAIRAMTRGGADPSRLSHVLAMRLQTVGSKGDVVTLLHGSPAPFFVWLMKDAIIERISELIAKVPQDGALSDDERDAAFEKIAAKRLQIERAEEAAICAAEAAGQIIQRRADADARAVLEIDA